MKANEILDEKEITENECGVCKLHGAAYNQLSLACPRCNTPIEYEVDCPQDILQTSEIVVVGETNYYSPEQQVEMMPVMRCGKCDNYIGFKLIPITYNANHDIYYTGGKDYLIGKKITMPDSMVKKIENYTKRIKDGENLDAWNLVIWLQYQMEHEIAKILYEKGLKY